MDAILIQVIIRDSFILTVIYLVSVSFCVFTDSLLILSALVYKDMD
jgi:hypothetical protein